MSEQRTIETDHLKIWTESLGDSANPAVLLMCGAGAHAHFWTDAFCTELVGAGFFLIRYDYRDVGLSGASESEYDLNVLADDVMGILNAYNLRTAHIVGHSMGGYLAQLLVAEHSERILSATLISTGPLGETPKLNQAHSQEEMSTLNETWRMMMRNRPTKSFEESLEGYLGVWRRLNGAASFDEAMAKTYTEELYTRTSFPVGSHDKHVKVMQQVAQTLKERSEIFSKMRTPMLIIHGAEDYLVLPGRGGEAIAEVVPNAKLEVIPKMGHMFFNREIEKEVADKIISFLKG